MSDNNQNRVGAFRPWHLVFVAVLAVATVFIIRNHNGLQQQTDVPFQKEEGYIFGTVYHLTYQADSSLHWSILQELNRVDKSLSMFNPQSVISRVNRNEDVVVDDLFKRVFELSQRVSQATDGAFDITVAPLVNAWGFGFKNDELPTEAEVDSLRKLVGWQRISIDADGRVIKEDPNMVLDCSAVAKGFGVDLAAECLRAHGVQNFMVEIGGEVIVAGINPNGEEWHVAVNKPTDDPTSTSNEFQTILPLTNTAMATSGNYRNFYTTEDGRRIAHTIDPATGYPVQHSLLSATVFAPTCAEADAFATSFMVKGLEGAKAVLQANPQLRAYLIYDDGGEMKVFQK